MNATSFLQQIGKAAKVLDLKGDVSAALKILEQVLNDPAIQHHLDIKAEAIVFAAELNHEIGNHDTVRKYLGQFNDIDLSQIEPDLIEHAVFTASQLKERIDSLSS